MNMPQQQQQVPPTAAGAGATAATVPTLAIVTATSSPAPSMTTTAAPVFAAAPVSAAKVASPSLVATGTATPKAATPRARASPTRDRTSTPKARTWSDANGTPRSNSAAPATPTSVTVTALPPQADNADSGQTGIENVMDELMAQYLRKRGYHVSSSTSSGKDNATTPAASVTQSPSRTDSVKHELTDRNGVAGSPVGVESAGRPRASSDERRRFLGDDNTMLHDDAANKTSPVTIEQYAQTLGLSTESCAANHMLFYGMTGGDPATYERAYSQLLEWICNALDQYKYELHAVAFPMFVHCFLELVAKGYSDHARAFLMRHAHDHMRLHVAEVRALALVFAPAHVRSSEYAQQVLHSKFNIQLSLLSFELLNAFLGQEQLFLLLSILNERVNLIVTAHQPPGIPLAVLDESVLAGHDATKTGLMMNIAKREQTTGFKTCDQVAQVVALSDRPNESEIGVPLTSGGEYNLEYMVHAAGGKGATLEDLHAIKVHWGVLKPLRLHNDTDTDASTGSGGTNAAGLNGNDDSTNGASGGAGGNASNDTTSNATSSESADKKSANAAGSDVNIGTGTGTSTAIGANKTNDKNNSNNNNKASDKTNNNSTNSSAADAQRKLKRAKLSPDASNHKKSELEAMGPVPDRRSAFHAEILEKLVLRQPTEMKIHALEDLRARTRVAKTKLPSALCFTFLNPSVHINSMCFSDDVTMVGAACADASFRVWRNDDQPLGTAKGSVYHGGTGTHTGSSTGFNGNTLEDTDEDETTATLRGHSSAVYGASFSPDNRFALTASADATVRLWSLASKSNLVTYRSHASSPVWDVQFGPFGYYFASCSMDRTARLWSTDRMAPLRVFAGHLADVDCVQFHPNHHYIATGSSDKTVRLWDVPSGKCVRVFTGHFHGVDCLAFSRNGRYLATSGADAYINIWDLDAGKRLATLVGHKAPVTSLTFSQESAVLASSGLDSTVRLWDMHALVEKTVVSATTASSSLSTILRPPVGGSTATTGFAKPVHMVRPSALQDLPTSRFLLETLRTKQTPMFRVHFTPRNLLLAGGVFQPKVES